MLKAHIRFWEKWLVDRPYDGIQGDYDTAIWGHQDKAERYVTLAYSTKGTYLQPFHCSGSDFSTKTNSNDAE